MRIGFYSLLLIVFVQCSNEKQKDLGSVLFHLEEVMGEEFIEQFKHEDEALVVEEFYTGMKTVLHVLVKQDTIATKYYGQFSFHPNDEYLHTILICWHRKLNNKEMLLDQQVNYILDRYKK